MTRRAFTLIELLVVISIVVLLIALLLPALRKARDVAHSAACLSNLRQIGIACEAYATDSEGFQPAPNTGPTIFGAAGLKWDDSLWRYLGGHPNRNFNTAPTGTPPPLSVYQCPADAAERNGPNATHFLSYTLNGGQPGSALGGFEWFQRPRRFEDMERVSSAVGIAKAPDGLVNLLDSHWWHRQGEEWPVRYSGQYNDGVNYYTYHGNGLTANALFFDGHARAMVVAAELTPSNREIHYRIR